MDKRAYKVKNPVLKFYCPRCGMERGIRYSPNLSLNNYLQIALTSLVISLILYPFLGMKGFISFFIILPAFDFINRLNFRKELTCPYCSFDAVWHKNDPNYAKTLENTKQDENSSK